MKRDWARLARLEEQLFPNLNRVVLERAKDEELEELEVAYGRGREEAALVWAAVRARVERRRLEPTR